MSGIRAITGQTAELTQTQVDMLENLDHARQAVLSGKTRGLLVLSSLDDEEGRPASWGRSWVARPDVSHIELVGAVGVMFTSITARAEATS